MGRLTRPYRPEIREPRIDGPSSESDRQFGVRDVRILHAASLRPSYAESTHVLGTRLVEDGLRAAGGAIRRGTDESTRSISASLAWDEFVRDRCLI